VKIRTVATAAFAVTVVLAVAGCTAGAGPAGSGDNTSFEFWSFSGINQKVDVEAYQKKHPNIRVKLTEVGTTVETAQALTTALAGGKVPDLVLIQGDDLPKFVEQPQNFHDLREYGGDRITGDYLDWVISQSTTPDGALLGVPTDVGGMAVAYRTDLFAAAKLPTDPAAVSKMWPDWPSFIETGRRYTAATGKPFLDNAETSIFYQEVNQGSEKYYDGDRKLAYDKSPQVKTAFDDALAAVQAGITAKQSSFTPGWSAALSKGQFAALAAPSWVLNQIRTNAPKTKGKWALATIPGRVGNWGGSYLAIPRNAKNPKAAWDYIAETQSPQGQLDHFLKTGALPTTPSVYQDKQLLGLRDSFFSGAASGQIYTRSLVGLKPFYIGPDSTTIGQEFLNAITDVEQGKADPAAAWDTALKNVRNAIGQ
jgi:cellobiose transport system substrate-binding protein